MGGAICSKKKSEIKHTEDSPVSPRIPGSSFLIYKTLMIYYFFWLDVKHPIEKSANANEDIPIIDMQFYKQLELLGKGGFGTVFRAFDPSTSSLLAIKHFPKKNNVDLKTILSEDKLLTKIEQINQGNRFIKYRGLFQDKSNGNFVIIMESGDINLRELLKFRPEYGIKEALFILKSLVNDLLFLKKHGISNRDIKSENVILVTSEGNNNFLYKVADFGIGHQSLSQNDLIDCDTVIGCSPRYAAPEVTLINEGTYLKDQYDPYKADVYSLGCVFLDLIKAKNQRDYAEKVSQIWREHQHNENLKLGLITKISKDLFKNFNDTNQEKIREKFKFKEKKEEDTNKFHPLEEFEDYLEALLENSLQFLKLPNTLDQILFKMLKIRPEKRSSLDEISKKINEIMVLEAQPPQDESQYILMYKENKMKNKTVEQIITENLLNSEKYAEIGYLTRAEDYLQLAHNAFEKHIADEKDNQKQKKIEAKLKLYSAAWAEKYEKNYTKAEKFYVEAVRLFENCYKQGDSELARCYNAMGVFFQSVKNESKKAEEYFYKSMVIEEKLLQEDSKAELSLSKSLNNAAVFFENSKKNPNLAESYFLRAMKIKERIVGKDALETAQVYHNLGVFYTNVKKNYQLAEEYLLKAMEIREKHLGTDHYETAVVYNNLGLFYKMAIKDKQKRDQYLRKAKNILVNLNKKIEYIWEFRGHFLRQQRQIDNIFENYEDESLERAYGYYWKCILNAYGNNVAYYQKALLVFEKRKMKTGHINYELGSLIAEHLNCLEEDYFNKFIDENDSDPIGFARDFVKHFKKKNDMRLIEFILNDATIEDKEIESKIINTLVKSHRYKLFQKFDEQKGWELDPYKKSLICAKTLEKSIKDDAPENNENSKNEESEKDEVNDENEGKQQENNDIMENEIFASKIEDFLDKNDIFAEDKNDIFAEDKKDIFAEDNEIFENLQNENNKENHDPNEKEITWCENFYKKCLEFLDQKKTLLKENIIDKKKKEKRTRRVFFGLAVLYSKARKFDQAEEFFNKSLDQNQNPKQILKFFLGQITFFLRKLKNPNRAEEILKIMLKRLQSIDKCDKELFTAYVFTFDFYDTNKIQSQELNSLESDFQIFLAKHLQHIFILTNTYDDKFRYQEASKAKINFLMRYLKFLEDANLKDKIYTCFLYLMLANVYTCKKKNKDLPLDFFRKAMQVNSDEIGKNLDYASLIASNCLDFGYKMKSEGRLKECQEFIETCLTKFVKHGLYNQNEIKKGIETVIELETMGFEL